MMRLPEYVPLLLFVTGTCVVAPDWSVLLVLLWLEYITFRYHLDRVSRRVTNSSCSVVR